MNINTTPGEVDNEKTPLVNNQSGSNDEQKSSMPTAIFNLMSKIITVCETIQDSAVGSGILALPFAFKSAGIILGLIAMIIISLLLCWSLFIIAKTSKRFPSRPKSFEVLVENVYGR